MDTLIDIALTILALAITLGASAIVIAFVIKVFYGIITELIDDIRKREDKIREQT